MYSYVCYWYVFEPIISKAYIFNFYTYHLNTLYLREQGCCYFWKPRGDEVVFPFICYFNSAF